jgi:hypothetical protein
MNSISPSWATVENSFQRHYSYTRQLTLFNKIDLLAEKKINDRINAGKENKHYLPFKCMAIESIVDYRYSDKSDM